MKLDYEQLYSMAEANAENYASAAPFPHIYLDNFLPTEQALEVQRDVPLPRSTPNWGFYYLEGYQDKWALCSDLDMPNKLRALIHEFNSGSFLTFLEKITGIPKLLPDPHLHGAGVHLVPRGGVLQIHADFNWAEHLAAHRRVNMFLYLNPDWRPEWGGDLELWATTESGPVASIAPLFNRLVIFSARSDTFHGHPHPLACPEGTYRQSLAMYYYTAERPAGEIEAPHNTLFKGLDR